MKTAEDVVRSIKRGGAVANVYNCSLVKKYAKQVAEQALKDAAENATYITVGDEISIVKSSITNTKIELP